MAEWSGPRHRRRGSPEAAAARPIPPDPPEAPGAVTSPQQPGQVPDRSTIAGQYTTHVEPATSVRRPLTEYQTAQRIIGVFAAEPGKEREPSRFEQATASFEEMRKADPARLPVLKPVPGYALEPGEALAQLEAGESAAETGF